MVLHNNNKNITSSSQKSNHSHNNSHNNNNNNRIFWIRKGGQHYVIFWIMLLSIIAMIYNTNTLHRSASIFAPIDTPQTVIYLHTSSGTSSNDEQEEEDDDKYETTTTSRPIRKSKEITIKQTRKLTKQQQQSQNQNEQQQQSQQPQQSQNQEQPLFIHTGEYFEPGSLIHQSHAKTLSQCYVGTKEKPYIIKNTNEQLSLCTYLPNYKFILRHGLRTKPLEATFMLRISNATYPEYLLQPCSKFKNILIENNDIKQFTVFDHPIERFISGIRLMFHQRGVFTTTKKNKNNVLPKLYNNTTMTRFLNLIKHMNEKEKENVSLGITPNDLMLKIQMYDTFIQDYYDYLFNTNTNNNKEGNDEEDLVLLHETMAISILPLLFTLNDHNENSNNNNNNNNNNIIYDIEQFDEIFNANQFSIDFEKLGTIINATHSSTKDLSIIQAFVPPPLVYLQNPLSITMESLSNSTIIKLCHLLITDFCCMNYKLPDICSSTTTIPDTERIQCEWVEIPKTTLDNNNNERRIIGRIGSSTTISSISSSSVTITSNNNDNDKNSNNNKVTSTTNMQKLPIIDNNIGSSSSNSSSSTSNTIQQIPFTRTGELFEPGTILNQSRAQIISQCYVGNKEFPYIKPNYRIGCSYSQKYNLLLWLIEKTGSNTQMHTMKHVFNSKLNHVNRRLCFIIGTTNDTKAIIPLRSKYNNKKMKVAVTRHPVDQFISGVKEVFDQTGVYTELEGKYGPNNIPLKYRSFMSNLNGMSREEKRNISMGKTPHDLMIATKMFEEFIQDYDGKYVFNTHIAAAIPKLFRTDLQHDIEQFDIIMDSKNLTNELTNLAKQFNTTNLPTTKKFRSATSFGTKALGTLSNTTIQKICQLVSTDLCCLNYKLPDICRHIDIPDNERVMCEWVTTSTGEKRIISSSTTFPSSLGINF